VRRAAAALLAVALTTAAHAQTIAITGGMIYPVSGPKIPGGTVLLRDGKIVAVGADVTIPDGATRVDAAGRWVTPGLIHLRTTLGLKLFESGAQIDTEEDTVTGDVKAAFNVVDGLDPASMTIPVARMEGVTSAVAMPAGGLIPGQAALIDLAGDQVDEMLVKAPAAMAGSSRAAAAGPAQCSDCGGCSATLGNTPSAERIFGRPGFSRSPRRRRTSRRCSRCSGVSCRCS
jgi:imidazolonepropionase-like amidohydrolase